MVQMSDRIAVKPLQTAVKRYVNEGHSWGSLAKEMGWIKPGPDGRMYGDVTRLRRCLGLQQQHSKQRRSDGRGVKYVYCNRRISYDNAVLIVRAIGRAPVDFDL